MQGVLQNIGNGLVRGLQMYVAKHGPRMVQQAAPVVTQAIQQATPVVTQAIQQATPVVTQAIQQATPVVIQAAANFMQGTGAVMHSKFGHQVINKAKGYLVEEGSKKALEEMGLWKH